jgi:hypothetical protein
MEQLRNLKQIYSLTAGRFNQYAGEDFVLPQIFKNQVKEINSNAITYNKYSAIIETRGNQNGVLNIYMPNQWFYIASYFTDFYNELLKYKSYALKAISRERLKDLNGSTLTEAEQNAIKQLDIDQQSQEYLKRFITDYSWWSGAKTIDRGDFYVSPILNSARLVNASQSFVADLCAFLADKEELVKAIITGEDNPTSIVKKELLRQKAAATFMKKAMRITLDKDNNLSHLAALNKYRKTSVQLQINGFNLGRDKNQLPNRIDDVDVDVAWIYDTQEYVLYLEWTPEMMEQQFFPVYNEAYQGMLKMGKSSNGEYVLYEETAVYSKEPFCQEPLQQIFYGAPGTGKSNAIKREVDDKGKTNFRVTFHPDSDYSTFVGCYKPAMKENIISKNGVESKEEQIVYRFVPQAFTKAYTAAWNTEDEVYLIIEEINRGNCAQIFGDLFQLLDRKNGVSEYPVDADSDLADYIRKSLKNSSRTDFPDGVKEGKKLVFPSNLFIWATMNTSDQSLFPIDSAFKRRWDWKYLPIENAEKGWKIKVNGNEYDWYQFLEAINKEVFGLTHSEDKQLGYFFAKAKDGIVDAETLVNKVYFYLWTDVFKDYDYESQKAFRKPNSNEPIAFKDFFKKGQELDEIMAEQVLINLELEKLNKPQDLFE